MSYNYDSAFFDLISTGSLHSARRVIPFIFNHINSIHRVVDVGCGNGAWLSVCKDFGRQVIGIDGNTISHNKRFVTEDEYILHDLRKPLPHLGKFDLCMSLEVAEHLPHSVASRFVNDLCSLSDLVLFSAAIPGQTGEGHVNEQWPNYWIDIFVQKGYAPIDIIRPNFWMDDSIEWWYAQNCFLFCNKSYNKYQDLLSLQNKFLRSPLPFVHPKCFAYVCSQASTQANSATGIIRLTARSYSKSLKNCLVGFIKRLVLAMPFKWLSLLLGLFFYRICKLKIASYCLRRTLVIETKNNLPMVISLPKAPPTLAHVKSPLISVIIPTLNRADSLGRCLESLQEQSFPPDQFEVIVVNNRSTDHTIDVYNRYKSCFPHIKLLHEPIPGLLAARHAGWRNAEANILTFCDDDIEALPDWLSTIFDCFIDDPKLGLVGGNNFASFEIDPPQWVISLWHDQGRIRWNTYHSLLEGITEPQYPPFDWLVFGCNFSIRRQALEAAGGFGPDVMENMMFQGQGETGVCFTLSSLGYKALLHPSASVIHHMPASRLTPEYMYKRGVYTGVESSYRFLRTGQGGPPSGRAPRGTTGNLGLDAFYAGEALGGKLHTLAALKSAALREWIMQPSYFGYESPPLEALDACRELAERFGW